MKVKTLSLLAGAAAFAATSVASAGTVGVEIIHTTGETNSFLAANNLQSITLAITGVPEGWPTLGVLGTGPNPWNLVTDSPNGFFNSDGQFGLGGNSIFSARPLAADDTVARYWDSGFAEYPLDNWGLAAGDVGTSAFSLADGGNEVDAIGTLIEGSGVGASAPGGPIEIFHVTWSADHSASGSFVFALVDPLAGASDSFVIEWSVTPGVPAPGALALLGLAGLVGTRRRRN